MAQQYLSILLMKKKLLIMQMKNEEGLPCFRYFTGRYTKCDANANVA